MNYNNLRSKVFKAFNPTIIYFISNTSFLTMLNFNIFDIDLIVYYASFEMLHTEVRFLQSNNLLFNPEIIIVWVSLTVVQYNTILTKKVQTYYEVMINYTVAVTSHARRNNVMSFCSGSYQLPFSQMILLASSIHIGLTLCSGSLLTSNPLCTKQGVSDSNWPEYISCHDVPPQFSSVTAGRQQTWERWLEFFWGCSCSTFDGTE